LGSAFYQWQVATAVACHLIGVNAFNQPDVQRAKDRTSHLLSTYRKRGALKAPPVIWRGQGITLMGKGDLAATPGNRSLQQVLSQILAEAAKRQGVSFLIYLGQERAIARGLARLRRRIRDRLGLVTSLGFGPRYLHSTGQLHKGGPGGMVHLVVTAEPSKDVEVPGMGVTFGVLERAQALGDLEALLGIGRKAYGLQLETPSQFKSLVAALSAALDALTEGQA
jgi:hypothetical protein